MQLHQIKPNHKLKKRRRIARGGKRGGYSGRGIKGQKSRAGAGIRPAVRDAMMRFPKLRGRAKHTFKSRVLKPLILNLKDIERRFDNGEIVSPAALFDKKMIRKKGGQFQEIKILGDGELTKKLTFKEVLLSQSAHNKIKKIGGTIK